jgi:exonuclease VII small subunit
LISALYLDAKLDKQLQALRRSDKRAALAVEKVHEIVGRLQAGSLSLADAGSTTKRGEQRLKGCMKYDLGGGYRLVTLKQKGDLYLLYAGSHDDCHRWLENNRELSFVDIRRRSRRLRVDKLQARAECDDTDNKTTDWKERDDFAQELDDRDLRTVFSGLIQSVQNRSSSL